MNGVNAPVILQKVQDRDQSNGQVTADLNAFPIDPDLQTLIFASFGECTRGFFILGRSGDKHISHSPALFRLKQLLPKKGFCYSISPWAISSNTNRR